MLDDIACKNNTFSRIMYAKNENVTYLFHLPSYILHHSLPTLFIVVFHVATHTIIIHVVFRWRVEPTHVVIVTPSLWTYRRRRSRASRTVREIPHDNRIMDYIRSHALTTRVFRHPTSDIIHHSLHPPVPVLVARQQQQGRCDDNDEFFISFPLY